jgi:hypothetical protein
MRFGVFLIFCTRHRFQNDERPTGLTTKLTEDVTPLMVFRPDLEFSTMTKFFPGLIKEAFQNSVPKSIPKTWASETTRMASISKKIFIFIL